MKKNNTYAGKMVAVLLILAFVGINFYKTEKVGGPQEQLFAKRIKQQTAERKFDNNISPKQNVEKLKFAYTGQWEKNELKDQAVSAGKHEFAAPQNTRNNAQAVTAKKAADKKKKLADKKKAKKTKLAKKYRGKRSLFDSNESDYEGGYQANNYYTQAKVQERAPSDKPEEPKNLSAAEIFALVVKAESLSPLYEAVAKGSANQTTYYTVAEMLLSSNEDKLKKLGFDSLNRFQSAMSLTKYAEHINDQMSEETKEAAEKTLEAYKQPSSLNILNLTLKSTNNELKIISANLIKDITSAILANQAAGTGQAQTYTKEQIEMLSALLTKSLNIIEASIQAGLDGTVVASFNSTRDIIAQFLG